MASSATPRGELSIAALSNMQNCCEKHFLYSHVTLCLSIRHFGIPSVRIVALPVIIKSPLSLNRWSHKYRALYRLLLSNMPVKIVVLTNSLTRNKDNHYKFQSLSILFLSHAYLRGLLLCTCYSPACGMYTHTVIYIFSL